MTEPDFPKLKRWSVSVEGYGTGSYIATTRGKALADAWRNDVFSQWTFGAFLKRARCLRADEPVWWGAPCLFEGEPARYYGHNRQYVTVQLRGNEFTGSAHPYDILPLEYRPEGYRDRGAA